MAQAAAQRVAPFAGSAECLPEQLELVREIGKGSFSVVYKARCTRDGTLVALKRVQASAFPRRRLFAGAERPLCSLQVRGMRDEKARGDCAREAALLQVSPRSLARPAASREKARMRPTLSAVVGNVHFTFLCQSKAAVKYIYKINTTQ